MKSCLIVFLLFGSAFCNLATILPDVVANTNTNNNGIIESEEITVYIQTFDTNANGIVIRGEFVAKWMSDYGDTYSNGDTLFTNLDVVVNNELNTDDLALHDANGNFDTNGDGVITVAEYQAFITLMYP